MLSNHQTLRLHYRCKRHPFMVSVPKPYVLRPVRSPSQNRMFLVRKPYGFGTENVKGRLLETDSMPFYNTLIHILLNKLSNEIKTVSQ